MNIESKLILEIWESVRDAIPPAKRIDVAQQHLRFFEEYGFEIEEMSDILGEDKVLDEAFKTLYEEDEEADVDSYDENGYGDEGDD